MSDHEMSAASVSGEEDGYEEGDEVLQEDETEGEAEERRGPGAIRGIVDLDITWSEGGTTALRVMLDSAIDYLTRQRKAVGYDLFWARAHTGYNAHVRVALFVSGPTGSCGVRRGLVHSEAIDQDRARMEAIGMELEEIEGRFIGPSKILATCRYQTAANYHRYSLEQPPNYHGAEDEARHVMEDWAGNTTALPGIIAYADGTCVRVARVKPKDKAVPGYKLPRNANITHGEVPSDPWFMDDNISGNRDASGRPNDAPFWEMGPSNPIATTNAFPRFRPRPTRFTTRVTSQAGSTLRPRYRSTAHSIDTGIDTRIAGISIFDETGPRRRSKLVRCWGSSIKGVSIYAEAADAEDIVEVERVVTKSMGAYGGTLVTTTVTTTAL